ncbi:uncharacterized protein LOC144360006 [Saccoglossus kowalevskii]
MDGYEYMRKIGRGAFGSVKLYRKCNTGEYFAGKKLKCDTAEKHTDAMKEIMVLSKVEHKHIVQIQNVMTIQENNSMCVLLFMDFCDKGTLNEYMLDARRHRMKDIHLKIELITQLVDATSFLHERSIVHRDLKPDNILIAMRKGEILAKIADFGLAKVAECIAGQNFLETMCGTPLFMAPEITEGGLYDEKVDIFSLGVIFLALLTNSTRRGRLEYYYLECGASMVLGLALLKHKRYKPTLPEDLSLSPEIKQAIISMVAYRPRKRPKAENILIMFTCEDNSTKFGLDSGYVADSQESKEKPSKVREDRARKPEREVDTAGDRKVPRAEAADEERLYCKDDHLRRKDMPKIKAAEGRRLKRGHRKVDGGRQVEKAKEHCYGSPTDRDMPQEKDIERLPHIDRNLQRKAAMEETYTPHSEARERRRKKSTDDETTPQLASPGYRLLADSVMVHRDRLHKAKKERETEMCEMVGIVDSIHLAKRRLSKPDRVQEYCNITKMKLLSLPLEVQRQRTSRSMLSQRSYLAVKVEEEDLGSALIMAKYNKIGKLRRGAFGEISLLKNRDTGEVFVGKKLKCDKPSKVSDAMNELFALAKLEHEHIVRIAGVHTTFVQDVLNIWLIMEYCPQGTLNDFIVKGERLGQNGLKRDLMKQLADAVSFLHEKRIVHRDIKPENILITMRDGQPQAKVADFGLAKVCASLSGQHVMTTFCGTEFFMAPEVFGHSYTEKADIFSLGVIFFALIERCTWEGHLVYHFKNRGHILSVGRALRENPLMECYLKEWFPISRKLKHLISSMLAYDPNDRPSARTVFRMLRREAVVESVSISPILQRKIARSQLPKTAGSDVSAAFIKVPHPPQSPRGGPKHEFEKLPKIPRLPGMIANSKYVIKEKIEPFKIKVNQPPSYILAPRPPPPRQLQKDNNKLDLGRPHTASRVPRPPSYPKSQKNYKLREITRPFSAVNSRFPQPPKLPKPDLKMESPKIRRPLSAAKIPHPPSEPRRDNQVTRLIRPRTGSVLPANPFRPPWKP